MVTVGIMPLKESCSVLTPPLWFPLPTAITTTSACQPLPYQPTESYWRWEAVLGTKTLQGKRLTGYTHMPCLETGSHLCGKSQAVSIRHSWKVGASWGWSQRLQKFPHLPGLILQICLLTPSWAPSHQATKCAKRRNQEDSFHTWFTVFRMGFFAALQNH